MSTMPPVSSIALTRPSLTNSSNSSNNNQVYFPVTSRQSQQHQQQQQQQQQTQALQYKLFGNNRVILLNRQTILSQLFPNRQCPTDNFCRYIFRHCTQNRLEGYNFCIRHILNDKNAPFSYCKYTSSITGNRCSNAVKRVDRRDSGLCQWHTKKKGLMEQKASMEKQLSALMPFTASNDSPREVNIKRKLEELEHYCPEYHDHRRKAVDWELPEDKCITASKSMKDKINESIIKYQNKLENEDEASSITLAETLNLDSVDSDNESPESYMDDPLRHAGVYTPEEIAHILRDKMLRLQTLYVNFLNYYRYLLKKKMKEYHTNLRLERENNLTARLNEEIAIQMNEHENYKILKAMHKYHNISGHEKIVKNAATEIRRALVEEPEQPSTPQYPKCIFIKDSNSCNQRCLPLSKYCKAHVLNDPYQVLYRPCACGSPLCLEPAISYVHKNSCVRHVQAKMELAEIGNVLKSPPKREVEPHDIDTTVRSMEESFLNDHNLYAIENYDLSNNDPDVST
ncbi:KAT8 regulatory NSL complex subunit 2 [Tyrophagus putrescentiae]|nr:KAT8 regulatory NSL complex subunit 2 [Tyrophagus putrescentiae]